MEREKSIVLELSRTPFDVENELHRNMLYSLQDRFFTNLPFEYQTSRW
jgi:hypothetical protein